MAERFWLSLASSLALAGTGLSPGLAQSLLSPAPISGAPAAAPPTLTPPALTPPAPPAVATPAPPDVPTPVIPGAVAAPPDPALATPTLAAKPKPKKVAPPPPPRETALSDDPTPSLQPETFFSTAKASERYAAIMDAGGWPRVPPGLIAGAKGPGVNALRARLAAEGDLANAATAAASFDAGTTEALKRFQFRHGLRQSGVAAGATLAALNIPVATRFRQLASSAQRLAGSNFSFGDRYVVVNIPSAAVETVENNVVVKRYIAVVGDIDHASPEVEAKVQAVNLNPTWTVPTSIIKNEIIPKMRKDPGYLARAKIRILDAKGAEVDARSVNWNSERAVNYTLRQDSGTGNSLGLIRINMPNRHSVYMHDTPSKRFFGADYRFLSHGCVRVDGVYKLAEWLLQGASGSPTGAWDASAIAAGIASGERQDIRVAKAVPVAWVYMSGWASADGTVHFRNDVYGYDSVGAAQAKADVPPAPAR